MSLEDASYGVAGAVSSGMWAALDAFSASIDRQRDASSAQQFEALRQYALSIIERWQVTIADRDALLGKLEDARRYIDELEQKHARVLEVAEKIESERNELRGRYEAVVTVSNRIVNSLRSRTTPKQFPELTDKAIARMFADARQRKN